MLFAAFRMELSQEGGNVVNWSLSTNEKAPHSAGLKFMAPRPGLEPGTHGLTVARSAAL